MSGYCLKNPSFKGVVFIVCLCIIFQGTSMAQTEQKQKPYWQEWLEKAEAVPEFKPPAKLSDWNKQRIQIRKTLKQLLGKLPPPLKKLEVRTLYKKQADGYVIEKFEFDNGAGAIVPGYLLLPEPLEKKCPAILYCHWHGGQYDIGKDEIFNTNAVPIAPGPTLARLGYAVIAIDAYCFGERNGKTPGGEKGGAGELNASKFNLWVGRTLWGMMLRDDLLALDYLCSRPEIDTNRIGVTGISMGATRTWWLMALDERLRVGVAVCCLTRYQNLIAIDGLKYHGIYYYVPGMLNHFDTEAVVALSAPRPLLFQSGELDYGSPIEGIKIIESKVKPIYELYKSGENFKSIIFEQVGHLYTKEMWNNTIQWFENHLKK